MCQIHEVPPDENLLPILSNSVTKGLIKREKMNPVALSVKKITEGWQSIP
jgi:hypothetical protein